MKILPGRNKERGLTRVELWVVIAAIGSLALIWFSGPARGAKGIAQRIQCLNNLKSLGLVYRIWGGDNGGKYPMAVAQTNGGSMEFMAGPNAWRHFQVMSNEMSTPKVLICPAESDPARNWATNFTSFNNSNLSYFVGVDANETNGGMFLSGDRNLTNGTPVKNGLLELTKNTSAGWTVEIHHKIGNIVLTDGSEQSLNASSLQTSVANTGAATNRLLMPVLNP